MTFPRSSYWFLIALAVVMASAHICAAPFHTHNGAITAHDEHESHHDGSGPSAVHAASCEALKTPSVKQVGAMLLPVGTVPVLAPPLACRLTEANAAVVIGSPPLFLLHAVLLI